jgi:hypothetical protein
MKICDDIKNVKSINKTAYNKNMVEAVDYAKNHDLITEKDAKKLKKMCNK